MWALTIARLRFLADREQSKWNKEPEVGTCFLYLVTVSLFTFQKGPSSFVLSKEDIVED